MVSNLIKRYLDSPSSHRNPDSNIRSENNDKDIFIQLGFLCFTEFEQGDIKSCGSSNEVDTF
jgi:hypothetical protein